MTGTTSIDAVSFDRPRPLPAALVQRWRRCGLWSTQTVSQVVSDTRAADRVLCVIDGVRYTTGDVARRSATVASVLHREGVGEGDRVVIQLVNSVELVVSIVACWHLGAIAVPVLPLFRRRELTSVVRQTTPAAVVTAADPPSRTADMDSALAAVGVRPAVRLCVGSPVVGWVPFPRADAVSCPMRTSRSADPTACVLVLFTSGTTSEPKGVRHDSQSLLAEVESYRRSAALTEADVVFNPAPVAHIGALVVTVLVPWAVGAPVVLQSRWNPQSAVDAIERERVTFAVGAPVFLEELVTRYESGSVGGHRVSKFQTGAAVMPDNLLARAGAVGICAWRAWGMTEAPTVSYGRVGDPPTSMADKDGRVEPGSEVVVVDDRDTVQSARIPGELWLRSPKQMMGYVDPARDGWRRDGWLATGDLGTVDADGWVQITGRVKDIVNRGGEKFSCREIEDALGRHSAVKSVAVLGVPEKRLGEQVVAYVTLHAGSADPGRERFIEHLDADGLAVQKHPVAIIAVDELPMTQTGKIAKYELAQRWIAGNR